MATKRLPRPRHGDPLQTTEDLRALAAAILQDDVQTLARTTAYLRRSYRVVFIGYVAMMIFGVTAIVAAFVKGITASSLGEAVSAVGLAGLTVGIFVAFFVQRPSAALERNAIFMPWVSIVLTTFWTRLLYLDDASDTRREARARRQGSVRRAERDRAPLRGDRRQGVDASRRQAARTHV